MFCSRTVVVRFLVLLALGIPAVARGQTQLPSTCKEILAAGGASGHYALYLRNDPAKPWLAYCDMEDPEGPAGYLQLIRTSTYSQKDERRRLETWANYSRFVGGGYSAGRDVFTSFFRLRVYESATGLSVRRDDRKFTETTYISHAAGVSGTADPSSPLLTGFIEEPDYPRIGSAQIQSLPYAMAIDCYESASARGSANIDLRGTPFKIKGTPFQLGGAAPAGEASFSHDHQVADLTGGGMCGWNSVEGVYDAAERYLELEYGGTDLIVSRGLTFPPGPGDNSTWFDPAGEDCQEMYPDGSWNDQACTWNGGHGFACRSTLSRYDWKVSQQSGSWVENGGKCPPGYVFSAPTDTIENEFLRLVMPSGRRVWLNLTDMAQEGSWESATPRQGTPPGFWRAGEPQAAGAALIVCDRPISDSRPCPWIAIASGEARYSCQSLTNPYDWRVSDVKGPYSHDPRGKCQTGYSFSVPKDSIQNRLLENALRSSPLLLGGPYGHLTTISYAWLRYFAVANEWSDRGKSFNRLKRPVDVEVAALANNCDHSFDMQATGDEQVETEDHLQSIAQTPEMSDGRVWLIVTFAEHGDGQIFAYAGTRGSHFLQDERVNGDANFYKGGHHDATLHLNSGFEDDCWHPSEVAVLPPPTFPGVRPDFVYLLVALQHCKDNVNKLAIYKFSRATGYEKKGIMYRPGNKEVRYVMVDEREGDYWLVLANNSHFDAWKASPDALFDANGTMRVDAWQHNSYGVVTDLGDNAMFVQSVADNEWRILAYDRSDSNPFKQYRESVNVLVPSIENGKLKISSTRQNSYDIELPGKTGKWGFCPGLQNFGGASPCWPNFAAGGMHYVTEQGKLVLLAAPHFAQFDGGDSKYWFHPTQCWDPNNF